MFLSKRICEQRAGKSSAKCLSRKLKDIGSDLRTFIANKQNLLTMTHAEIVALLASPATLGSGQ